MTPVDGMLGCLGCWCVAGLLWLASRIWYAVCMQNERIKFMIETGILSRADGNDITVDRYACMECGIEVEDEEALCSYCREVM